MPTRATYRGRPHPAVPFPSKPEGTHCKPAQLSLANLQWPLNDTSVYTSYDSLTYLLMLHVLKK